MQISAALAGTAGVERALVAMATELNLDLLPDMGIERPTAASPNDLLVAVVARDGQSLATALDMLEREGLDGVYRRHATVAAATRAGLEALGFRLFADPDHFSQTVTNAWLPDGVEWKTLNKALLERNLVIAGGQGKLAGKTLRVGHLGDVDLDDILAVMSVLEEVMLATGLPATAGAGVAAAERAGLATIAGGSTSREAETVAARP